MLYFMLQQIGVPYWLLAYFFLLVTLQVRLGIKNNHYLSLLNDHKQVEIWNIAWPKELFAILFESELKDPPPYIKPS